MSHVMNSQIHIFLVQPLDKSISKEMIVYADTEQQARTAAALAADFGKNTDSIYLDGGMSICIETDSDLLKVENTLERVQVKYNEVMYDLKKDEAQEVIAENIL